MKLCPFSKKLKVKQRLFTFLHNSRSTQAQSNEIISSKMWIYELPRELPNELRPRILRNYKISRKGPKCLKLMGIYSASHLKRQFWQFCYKTSKKISCNAFCTKTYAALFYGFLYHIFSKVVKLSSIQEMHCSYKCLKYNKLSLPKRFTFVKSKRMCFKRLRKDVLTSNYKLKLTCF